MKKLFQIGAALFCILLTQSSFAAEAESMTSAQDMSSQSVSSQGQGQGRSYQNNSYQNGYNQNYSYSDAQGSADQGQNCCPQDAPCDQPVNDCWCKYVHYEPCYYTTKRCIQEQVPYTERCCRYVPKYYQVQRCRYVPQYYSETCCRQEPEYYDVCKYKCCDKYVCDTHCKYVPKCYWKHICGKSDCATPCPQ